MTSTLQNRLVGTIIVVALVVILVPEFLDGEKRVNKQEFVNVPPVAELVQVQNTETFDTSEVQQQVNQSVELVDELPVDADDSEDKTNLATNDLQTPKTAQDIEPKDATTELSGNEPTPSINNDLAEIEIKDSGWVVQLGSFKHEKNVKELLNTLNNAGYRAYSRPVMTSVGELTKVFVGPELDKEKLELALPHLTEITHLKGKITAFEVSAG
jgi:DedD protein